MCVPASSRLEPHAFATALRRPQARAESVVRARFSETRSESATRRLGRGGGHERRPSQRSHELLPRLVTEAVLWLLPSRVCPGPRDSCADSVACVVSACPCQRVWRESCHLAIGIAICAMSGAVQDLTVRPTRPRPGR
jgi:hypothetical protein